MRLISLEAGALEVGVTERTIRRWMTIGLLTRYERHGPIRILIDGAELSELVGPRAVRRLPPETSMAAAAVTPTDLDANG